MYFEASKSKKLEKLENLQEIGLFLDSPLYLIKEEKQPLSELVDVQSLIVFFFSKNDQYTQNKQGEVVLDKMIAALAAKQTKSPKIIDIPITLIEIAEKTPIEWDFEKLSVKKMIFFGKEVAEQVGIIQHLYEFFSIQRVICFVADTLKDIEAEQSKKMQLWKNLLMMFVDN